MAVDDEFPDVLQNIEFAIVSVFEQNPDFADRDVLAAVEVLINSYSREGTKRERLSPGPPVWRKLCISNAGECASGGLAGSP